MVTGRIQQLTWRIAAGLLFAFLISTASAIEIEKAQRAFQERYKMAMGAAVSWPANVHSQSAPEFPPDGFYEDDLADPETAASLVSNLAAKMSDSFLNKFVTMPELEGSPNIPVYATAWNANPGEGAVVGQVLEPLGSVNEDNYVDKFKILAEQICKLRAFRVTASQAGPSGSGSTESRTGYSAMGANCDLGCTGVRADANTDFDSGSWSAFGGTDIYMSEGEADDRPNGQCQGYWMLGYQASLTARRGVVTANLSGMVGNARCYVKTQALGSQASNSPPVPADGGWHLLEPAPVGGMFISRLLGEKPQFTLSCLTYSGPSGSQGAGWQLSAEVVIVEPHFEKSDEEGCGEVCRTCKSGSCRLSGTHTSTTSSINVELGLGNIDFGKSAGSLFLKEDFPGLNLAKPIALRVSANPLAYVVQDTNGLRQVKVPEGLADIVAVNDYKYEVRFYAPANIGTTNSSGIYQPSGSTFAVITIENPDTTNAVNKIRVTETRGSNTKISNFEYDAGQTNWSLVLPSTLRKESHTETWDAGHTNRTEVSIVRNSNDAVVFKQSKMFKLFAWGEEQTQQIVDPDTAALTTSWTYYTNSVADGFNYTRLKEVVHPNGYWERYQYDAYGRTTNVVAQFLSAVPGASESSSRVTTTVYGSGDPAITTIKKLQGTEIGRRYTVYRPGETQEIVATAAGAAWNSTNNLVTVTKTYLGESFNGELQSVKRPDGTMTIYEYSESSGQKTTTVYEGKPNAGGTAIDDGTKTITVVDASGNMLSETVRDIASNLVLSSATTTETDDFGRPTEIEYNDGTTLTRVYGCCGLESETDREGITTSYLHDDLNRVIATTRAGITTLYTYDAEGRVLTTVRKGSDDSEITLNESTYDLAGRLTSSKDALNHTTSFTETIDANGNTVKTTTYPNSTTRIEKLAADGSLLEVSGTAVHPLKYDYGVESNQLYTKEIKVGSGGSETEWTKNLSDIAGRPVKTIFADDAFSQLFYNIKGQLIKQVDPDGITTLFQYNDKGEQEYVILDLNQNGSADFSGTDRIVRTHNTVATAHDTTVRRTTTTLWPENNSGTTTDVSVSETSADGLKSWNTVLGLTTEAETVYDGEGARTVTMTHPDGSKTINEFEDGRLISAIRKDSSNQQIGQTTYEYDPHGRQTTVTDARTGATTIAYDNLDQVTSTTTSSLTTSFTYDDMGRRTQITFPDSGVVTNTYFDTGELEETSGARTYTAEYTYDTQGRIKTLLAGIGTTTWNYDSQRGFLTSKVYDDDEEIAYTYTDAGRLLTREWARGITTTYAYNNAGNLASVNYSDSTPDVSYSYDRPGRPSAVTDGAGTHDMTYNAIGRLLIETHTGGPLDGVAVNRTYALNRLATLGAAKGTNTLSSVSYGYDGASRLQTVTDGARTATHGYLTNSNLAASIAFKNGGATVLTTSKSYDNLNRLTQISFTPSNDTARSYTYTYNSANQRTRVDLADGSYWLYQYDTLGQVVSGKKHFSDATAVSSHQFQYSFDSIGNRTSTTNGTRQATYTANSLNQYTQRTVPNAFDIFGSAKTNATVTVNNEATARKGEFFYKELGVTNSAAPAYVSVNVVGVKNEVGGNNEDAVTQKSGNVYVPKTPEVFTYDDDGNLLSDGRWNYTWDGENRLIAMEAISAVPATAKKKLEFAYDYQGRRLSKKVYNWNAGSSSYDLAFTSLCVYDGWNKIAELDGAGNLLRSHVCGNDLSGSMQGAGGVGGLLFTTHHSVSGSPSYAVGYDGNGNVTALTDMADGKIQGEYEYSPFGETLRADGDAGELNTIRFSTKETDLETGFAYYGYRYLNPSMGGWPNRDPIGEDGGVSVYSFCSNDAENHFDVNGLFLSGIHRRLTRLSLDDSLNTLRKKLKLAYVNKIFKILADANTGQDGGAAFNDLRRHFNRPHVAGENFNDANFARRFYDLSYRRYLLTETSTFNINLGLEPKCRESLETLGRLSHSWQDFYAHAVSDAYSTRFNRFIGFDAWTFGYGGNPNDHPGLWPSSYNDPLALESGEHPNLGEPVSGLEAESRRIAAVDFVAGEYHSKLKQWLEKCSCWLQEEK